MDQQDLSKLGRKELLTMLLDVTKENESLQEQVNSLQEQVDNKEIKINECGSLAEASLQLNDIFTKADEAAKQYLANVETLKQDQMKLKLEAETSLLFTQQKCFELEENTKQRCAAMEEETSRKCTEMVATATKEADDYQASVLANINHLKEEYEKVFSIFKNITPMTQGSGVNE